MCNGYSPYPGFSSLYPIQSNPIRILYYVSRSYIYICRRKKQLCDRKEKNGVCLAPTLHKCSDMLKVKENAVSLAVVGWLLVGINDK